MEVRIEARVEIARPVEEVFDFVTTPSSVAATFRGHGPIPGTRSSEIVGGGPMKVGSIRRVVSEDGSVVDEEIVELERPRRQAYRLLGGFKPPFSWLIAGAHGSWTLEPVGASATRITWVFTFVLRSFLAWPFAVLLRRPFFRAMSGALAPPPSVHAD